MLDKKIKGMGNVTAVNTTQQSQSVEQQRGPEINFEAMEQPVVGGVSSDEFDKLTQRIDTMQSQMEKDKEEWSKSSNVIDKLKRRMNENEENIKNQKTQITTQSQTIVNLQSEIGFKVDRDAFEQAVHIKL